MSWRRFLVLLGGLSPESAFIRRISKKGGVITDPQKAMRVAKMILGGKKKNGT